MKRRRYAPVWHPEETGEEYDVNGTHEGEAVMEFTLSTLAQRHRVATPEDLGLIEHQGNFERPIALRNLRTGVVCPLTSFIIPQYSLMHLEEDVFFSGFSRGNHAPVRARIQSVESDGAIRHHFEVQDMGSWKSPFEDGGTAVLYILR